MRGCHYRSWDQYKDRRQYYDVMSDDEGKIHHIYVNGSNVVHYDPDITYYNRKGKKLSYKRKVDSDGNEYHLISNRDHWILYYSPKDGLVYYRKRRK